MTSSIVSRSFASVGIRIRQADRYVCLTDMAQASGVTVSNYKRLPRYKIIIRELIKNHGGKEIDYCFRENNQTWSHFSIAMGMAYIAPAKFSIWFNETFIWKPLEDVNKTDVFMENLSKLIQTNNQHTTFVTEAEFRDHISKSFQDAECEVYINNKRYIIDILTNDHLIEVKHIKNWDKAITQLLEYWRFYPTKQKVLCLFGESKKYGLHYISACCFNLNIELRHYDNAGNLTDVKDYD